MTSIRAKKWLATALAVMVLLLAGCVFKDKCPQCNDWVEFTEDVYCHNCGFIFGYQTE